jgi:DNA-binding beta-propeller fold protein YncE
MRKSIVFGLAVLAGIAGFGVATVAMAQDAPDPDPLYTLESVTTLPSTDSDWDYMKLEANGPRLFIARRGDGLTVYDVDARKVIATVANSAGANGPLLLPQYNRGYVATTDGALLSFNLKTLAVIERIKLADDGGLNTVSYEPTTRQIIAVVGARDKESAWFALDAATGKPISKKVFPFKKMDEPAPDGKGGLFAPVRYDNLLLKLDAKTLEEKGRWNIDCVQVVVVEYHKDTDRLLIGCRGDKPVLIALDATTGKQVASIPIGKGIDGMAFDHKRHRILTSNGGDSSLTVIQQDGPDSYRLLGNVQTRPRARIMQIDERSGKLYLITADATMNAAGPDGKAPAPYFHPNSFVVMTYKPM